MKIPRWLVISMLTFSVLAMFAAPGWWWVMWPERTASEFVLLMNQENFDDIRSLLRTADFDPYSIEDAIEAISDERADLASDGLLSVRRAHTSWSDVITGAGHFRLCSRQRASGFDFTAVRGNIKFHIGGYAIISR